MNIRLLGLHGILVQLPLPENINEKRVLEAIRVDKDVDAFHPYNTGRLFEGDPEFVPCTPAGIMELLKAYDIDPAGKECVVVGRSNIVGKPIAHLLLQANGTVTICHSKTNNLKIKNSLKEIGIDLTTDEPFDTAFKFMREQLEELKKLHN